MHSKYNNGQGPSYSQAWLTNCSFWTYSTPNTLEKKPKLAFKHSRSYLLIFCLTIRLLVISSRYASNSFKFFFNDCKIINNNDVVCVLPDICRTCFPSAPRSPRYPCTPSSPYNRNTQLNPFTFRLIT